MRLLVWTGLASYIPEEGYCRHNKEHLEIVGGSPFSWRPSMPGKAAAAGQPLRLAAEAIESALDQARAGPKNDLPDLRYNPLRQVSYQGQRAGVAWRLAPVSHFGCGDEW
jgi:hypothetical protein